MKNICIMFLASLSLFACQQRHKADFQEVKSTTTTTPAIDGAFIYLGTPDSTRVPPEKIAPLLDELNGMRMKTILFSGVRTLTGECKTGTFKWGYQFPEKLGPLLDEAQTRGMELYVGVSQIAEACGSVERFLQGKRIAADIEVMVKELETKFGSHPAFRGWYIPDEPNIEPPVVYPFYKSIAKAIRAHSQKTITIAPYLASAHKVVGPKLVAAFAKGFLNATKDDAGRPVIQIWQDSVGATGNDLSWGRGAGNVEEYYREISQAIGRENLWSDNEVFTCCVPPFDGTTYGPATMTRLREQLRQSRSDFVSKRVIWLPQVHMGSVVDDHYKDGPRLAAAYKASQGISGSIVQPVSYQWLTPPAAKYPDQGRELIDQQAADPTDYKHKSWAAVEGVAKLRVELAVPTKLSYIALQTFAYEKDGIFIPGEMKVTCFDEDKKEVARENVKRTLKQSSAKHEFVFANEVPFTFTCKSFEVELINGGWTFLGEIELTRL